MGMAMLGRHCGGAVHMRGSADGGEKAIVLSWRQIFTCCLNPHGLPHPPDGLSHPASHVPAAKCATELLGPFDPIMGQNQHSPSHLRAQTMYY